MATIDFDTSRINAFSAEDFETASIRSAAPSYISEAPSYHTTVSTTEPIPPYSPPQNSSTNTASRAAHTGHTSLLPSHTAHIPSPGLPPIPPARSSSSDIPSLGAFRIPSWSVSTNPMYQRVATRRAQAAMSSGEGLVRNAARVLERVNEESSGSGSGSVSPAGGDGRVRPLEDPYLVGEVAAARARRERLARENGDDILHREDRRWDWFLGTFAKPLFPAVSDPLPRVP
ncbi:hypothetical protein N8I77_010144 [Diaporthe amygdali]|uniref:Uncharacterized protein n=1 Tax=Phomopsis amygdali TaxID=1214568 RepID=A0AAD9S6R2_PHOAM|nr:hypothetical protein N8I77_010144 [Diaporthe amygdali]